MLKLDDRDIRILKILAREGRITKAELAKRINLSPTPCWERMNRLIEAGIVKGFQAEISLAGLGPSVTVFVTIELERHRAESFQNFERVICRREEIVGCWALGGGHDYLMQIITRDIDKYQRLMDSLLEQQLGIERYQTFVVTKPVKTSQPPPFDVIFKAEGDESPH